LHTKIRLQYHFSAMPHLAQKRVTGDDGIEVRLERIKALWHELQRTKKAIRQYQLLVEEIREEADAFGARSRPEASRISRLCWLRGDGELAARRPSAVSHSDTRRSSVVPAAHQASRGASDEAPIIGKAALPIRPTKKSHVEMQELAFFNKRKPSRSARRAGHRAAGAGSPPPHAGPALRPTDWWPPECADQSTQPRDVRSVRRDNGPRPTTNFSRG
jgi:hypothetical protein